MPGPSATTIMEELGQLLGTERAREEWQRCRALKIDLLDGHSLPPGLLEVPEPPRLLYVRGRLDPSRGPALTVVGSRRATPLGLRQAYRLGAELAAAGICVLSGLARGIDCAALEGAVSQGSPVGAVLGNGLPEIYPPEKRALADRIVASGGFVATELPLDAPPRRHHFPRRNRILSALGQGVVVVEAALRSGSLITVGWALEQGRDVFAFPGPSEGPEYAGCHALIQEGAHLVTCADDVLAVYRADSEATGAGERRVREAIRQGATTPEEVMEETGLPAERVLQAWVRATRCAASDDQLESP